MEQRGSERKATGGASRAEAEPRSARPWPVYLLRVGGGLLLLVAIFLLAAAGNSHSDTITSSGVTTGNPGALQAGGIVTLIVAVVLLGLAGWRLFSMRSRAGR
jgi:hypothetical protein